MVTPQFHKTLVVGRGGGNGTNILSVDWAKPFRRALGLLPSSFKDVTPAPLQHLFPDPGAGRGETHFATRLKRLWEVGEPIRCQRMAGWMGGAPASCRVALVRFVNIFLYCPGHRFCSPLAEESTFGQPFGVPFLGHCPYEKGSLMRIDWMQG